MLTGDSCLLLCRLTLICSGLLVSFFTRLSFLLISHFSFNHPIDAILDPHRALPRCRVSRRCLGDGRVACYARGIPHL